MEKPLYIGCDDSGFAAKQMLLDFLGGKGIPCVDCGSGPEPSRYPWYAAKVASAVSDGRAECGILLCGSGIGMCMAANKYPGVRAAAISDVYSARLTRRHNDCNLLCLGGQTLGDWQLRAIVEAWLDTDYDGGHHEGSLELLRVLERVNLTGRCWCPEEPPYPPFSWNPEQSI